VPPKNKDRPSGAVVYSVAFNDTIANKATVLTLSSSGYLETWPIPQE